MIEPDPWQFNETGDCFSINEPRSLERADFDLWNDTFSLRADHTGKVEGSVFTPNSQPYADNLRPVYCLDAAAGEFWNLTWGPVHKDPPVFSFDIRLDRLSWLQEYNGIASVLSVAVPREAALEAWNLQLSNQTGEPRTLGLIIAIPTGLLGLLSHESELIKKPFGILHHYFPYYVKIPDYGKMARRWNTTFLFIDREPGSWTALERDFLGFGGWSSPDALRRKDLGGRHCHYERGLCGCRYDLLLAPGENFQAGWILGPARNGSHALEVAGTYPPEKAFAMAVEEQVRFRKGQHIPLRIQSPDAAFNHYINHWSPDRSIRIGRTFRFNPSPQARNAIQDTMTLSLFDPQSARERFRRIWRHQEADGFMPHGLPMFPDAELMPITLIPHKDTNVWGPIALDVFLRETGDYAFLESEVSYTDGSGDSLAGHLETGLRWLLRERSPRGLSLIGQGDWNDPLNMAGPEGRGESVWLTQALACSLDIWAGIVRRCGQSPDEWVEAAEACRNAVREHAWDGNWFLRAFSDDGTPIGSAENEAGAIFLNSQSWALMAGIPDKEQTGRIIASVKEHLDTRIAPAVLAPPYPGMAQHVGKLTLKSPGTGENGSIYSHAALFWSFALYRCGHPDEAWRVLRNLLPGTPENTIESAGQVPLYIPNFYRGPAAPEVFGRSSHSPNTGSAAWVYLTFLEMVAGLRGDGDALVVDPRLPEKWGRLAGERVFRGTRYRFTIERGREPAVFLNGKKTGRRVQWQSTGEPQELRIVVP
ncbi:MAG: GH36-type glycosyl hydrolase domain-containing protein [Oceanipulchritudo sp.]